MSYNLGTAQGRIDLSYTGTSAVRRAQADVGRLQGILNAAGVSAGMLGKAAAVGVGGALVAGLVVAGRAASNFEKQISAINAVSGATPAQLDAIREKALQLGADTAFSASESANAMEELVKAGLSVEEVLGGAADAAVALAAAGGIGIPEAATIASNAMNQFNLSAAELEGVVDDIAGAANASAIDVGDLGMSISQVGAVANLAGLTFKDTATAIALLGNAGIKGSDAGTSLKTMLQNLQPQTEKQIGLFEELGIVTEDGTNRFFDAEGNVKSFAGVSGVLQEALKGQTRQQKIANLEIMFGTDAIRAAAIAADAGAKGVNNMQKEMSKMTAADVAAKRMDNLSGSIEQLGGSIETSLIAGGSGLLVAVRSIVDALTAGVNAATEFGQDLGGRVSPGFQDLAAAAGNVLDILGNVWDMFDTGGSAIAGMGLDLVVFTFNLLASVLETVTGALEGQEELIIMVGAAWLIMANGGLARVIAQLGYLAAYAVIKALDGLMLLQAGATATGTALGGLAAKAAAAAATLGAVAAITSAVFAWMAYKKAVNEVEDAVQSASEAMKTGSLEAMAEQEKAVRSLNEEYQNLRLDEGLSGADKAFQAVGRSAKALFTLDFDSLGKMMNMEDGLADTEAALDKVKGRMTEVAFSTIQLAQGVNDIDDTKMRELIKGFDEMDPAALTEIENMWAGYETQLAQVGISQQEVINAWKNSDPSDMQAIQGALVAVRTDFGRTEVASKSAADAVESFGDGAKSTAEAADQLKASLDALIGVELNADQATINWLKGLKDLKAQISETNGAIRGNSMAALDNRQAIINSTGDLLGRIDAEARAGASAQRLTNMLKNGRQAIIDNAVAAGANRKEVEKLIKTYNLTPKEIRTLVEAAGADSAKAKMEKLINEYRLTPKQVRSIIEAAGATTAAGQVKALRDYINGLQDKTVRVTMYETVIAQRVFQNKLKGDSYGARGGFSNEPDDSQWGLESYAHGGIRNLAAGIYRGRRIMFAEPGTGGEAFIPLADHKRKRSEALLGQVASIFGGAFVKFADGGFNNLAEGIASTRFAASDHVAVGTARATIPVSAPAARGTRILGGSLRLEGSEAVIRGYAEDVYDDDEDFNATIGRMG